MEYRDELWNRRLEVASVRRYIEPELRTPGTMLRLGSVTLVDYDILRVELWRSAEPDEGLRFQYIALFETDGPMLLEPDGLVRMGYAFRWKTTSERETAARAVRVVEAPMAGWTEQVIAASSWLRANAPYHLAPRMRGLIETRERRRRKREEKHARQ